MTDILIDVDTVEDVLIDTLGAVIEYTIIEIAGGDIDGGFGSARYGGTIIGGTAIDGGDADSIFDGPTIDGGDAGPPTGQDTDFIGAENGDLITTEDDLFFLGWQ